MHDALLDVVERKGRPFLGICVGMQLMSSRGLEKTVPQGLGWIEGDVKELRPSAADRNIPRLGWNPVDLRHPHPLFVGLHRGCDGRPPCSVHPYNGGATHSAD